MPERTQVADRLVHDYLQRLAAAVRDLPRDRRDELGEEIAAHIAEARAAGATSEAELRTVLDRLGDPEDIAAAARGPRAPYRVSTGQETTAVLLLTLGSLLLPIVGWLIGAVLLWSSDLWDRREKLLGTLVVPGGLALPAFLTFSPSPFSCWSTGTVDAQGREVVLSDSCSGQVRVPVFLNTTAVVLLVLAPLVAAYVLRLRAWARSVGEPVPLLGSGLTAFGRGLVVLLCALAVVPLAATLVLDTVQGRGDQEPTPGITVQVPARPSPR